MSEPKRLSDRNAAIQAMLTDGEKIKDFYRFAAQNPHITLRDACQIIISRPNASVCYSFEEWNAMGRRVSRGRKGIPYYDTDGSKQYVFDANDTYGEERYKRFVYPIKRLLQGLDELNGTEMDADLRGDYRKIHVGVATYLQENGYFTDDEERNRLILEGVTYSLYCKTGFPKSNGITMHGMTGELTDNAQLFKDICGFTDFLYKEIEDAYVRKETAVQVIDDVDEETVSDEPIVAEKADEAKKIVFSDAWGMYRQNYVILDDYNGETDKSRIFIGKAENFDVAMHKYDNSDDSLIFATERRQILNLLYGRPFPRPQQTYIDNGTFTAEDYAEYDRLRNGALKEILAAQNLKFDYDQSVPDSGVPFNYPNWQGKKQEAEQAGEQPKPQVKPYYAKYLTVQEKYPNAIVMVRLGDFYEMMGVSAEVAATELDLTLTGRNVGIDDNENRVPMCGVPFHATELYIEKLRKTHSVVVLESENDNEPKYYPSLLDGKSREKTPQEQLTEWGLKLGSGFENGKFRIYDKYKENPTVDEFIAYLKKEYGIGGGGYELSYWHDGKGLKLQQRDKSGNELYSVSLKWKEVAIGIADLIDDNEYLNAEEKEKYVRYEVEQKEHKKYIERGERLKDQFVKRVILATDEEKKARIQTAYLQSPSTFVQYLRTEYEREVQAGDDYRLRFNINEFWLTRYDEQGNTAEKFTFSLSQFAERIGKLIDSGEYMSLGKEPTPEQQKIKSIADEIIKDATDNATESYWFSAFSDFGADEQFVCEHKDEIVYELEGREEVADVILEENGIDVNYYTDYLSNYITVDFSDETDGQRSEDNGDRKAIEPPARENTDLNEIGFDQSELGGAKARFKSNVEAIKLLKRLDIEKREPTRDEQKTLAKYVGWGGLSQAFDEHDEKWRSEYAELISLLDSEDYEKAKGSVLNAHYTSKEVIDGIYRALERFGVKGNNRILEPAMGTGNFFGYMPKSMQENARLYGVELDNITGELAQKLYPKANIQVKGYENTTFPNNHFDIVVGNVPFGAYTVYDSEYSRNNFYIHDYFLAKSISKKKS